ncbi:hypothetical protein UJ101_01598 [Flavobacteriaceae bacterium UJ101]|nr:hypothetical protein UJ101_01598 [Flavobacteriaceae bacterium UJ101]
MNIKKQLLAEHSKANCEKIASYIGKDAKKFDELVQLMIYEEHRIAQRASHTLQFCTDLHPSLVYPYTQSFIDILKQNPIDAVKRCITRSWEKITLPEEFQGEILQIAFDFVQNPQEAIAVRAYCITILFNITQTFSELQTELSLVLQDIIDYENSPALLGRSKKVLKKLKAF